MIAKNTSKNSYDGTHASAAVVDAPQPSADDAGMRASAMRHRAAQSGRGAKGGTVLLSLLCALLMAGGVSAQTARVAGEVTNFGSSLLNAGAIAVDGSRNAYAVTTAGAVYKETFNSSTGVYTENQLFTVTVGTNPRIAVDRPGANIFVATGTGNTVVQSTGSGTSYSATPTRIFSGGGSTTVAVDASESVYITDASTGGLYKETYSGTSYSGPTQIATGLGSPNNLTIDSTGNLFLSNNANAFYKVAGSGTSYTATVLTVAGVTNVTGLVVDASDDLFLSSSNSGEVYEGIPSGSATYAVSPFYQYAGSGVGLDSLGDVYLVSATQTAGTLLTRGSGYLNFGSVGPSAPVSMTVAFTLTSATTTTLGVPTALTQGLTGYDYTLGTGSTCTNNHVLAQGDSCTVVVQFSPLASGSRLGAVNLVAGGTTIGSSFLGGVGFASLAAYQSVTLLNTIACPSSCSSSLPNGLSNGRGITVDPAGDVWVANSTAYQILKFPAGSTTPVVFSTVTGNGNCSPVGTALDGEGNVFYTCNGETNMYELVGGAGSPVTIPVGVSTDDHLSVDAAGNLYPTSYQPSNYFLKVAAGTHAVSVIATAPSGARFVGAVTDAAGNTFAPDYNNDILYELPAGSNTLTKLYSGAPLQAPHAIAEDAAGNLYVTTTVPGTSGSGNSPLLRFASGSYTATPASLSVPGGDSLYITPNGNFYTVYSNSTLAVYSRSVFALTFLSTPVGQTSASQTVVLENDGTAPLTISPPPTGTNPSVSQNFTYDPSSTCPELSMSSAAITLGVGSSCTQVVEFTPQLDGSISGSLVTTDNSANVPGSTQTINMSGTATQGTPTVSVSNVSGTLGQSVTLSATVSGGGVAPTGAVSFVVGGGATVPAVCSGGVGSETCTATYSTGTGLVGGANTITASVAADANYLASSGTGTLTLAPAPTTSSVVSALNPSTYGASVKFTATVSSGYGTPTGSVTFYDGSVALTTVSLNGSGVATFTTSALAGGSHAITVGYGGTTTFATSTSSPALTQVVKQAAPTVTVTNVSGTLGQSVTLSATVSGGGVAPAGAVSFVVGSGPAVAAICSAGTGVETCTAAYSTSAGVVAGANTITASVAADTNYLASSGTGTLTLNPAVTTSSVISSLNPSTYVASVKFTATVASGYGTPTGLLTFYDGSTALTTVSLNGSGVATFTTSALVGGSHSITVSYGGTTTFAASTSSPALTQVVKQAAPTVTVTNVSGTLGQSVTLTATVSGGGVAPVGAVSFAVGSGPAVAAVCSAGTGVETCTATYSTSTGLAGGANTITASFAGDANYLASSGTGTLTLNAATTTSSVVSSLNPSTYGASVTFTATVASGYGTPTGLLTFYDGASALTTASLNGSGVATFTTSTLKGGSHAITVGYGGSTTFATSTSSPALTQVVNPAAGTTGDSATGSGTYGAASTVVTVTIPYAGAVAPTGNITVGDTNKNTVTISASVCTASAGVLTCKGSLPTANDPAGSNSVTVSQAADTNYGVSTGGGTITLSKAAGGNGDTATGIGTYGAPTTVVSVTIPYTGATSPTGAITLTDTHGNTVSIAASGCSVGGNALTCNAALPTATEPVGANAVAVSQAADTNYAASTGGGTVTIGKAPATSNDTVNGTGTYAAATTPVVITIPYAGTAAPTGAVTVADGFGNTATASACSAANAVLTCTANLPTANEPTGANPVAVSQAGDMNYSGSTGSGTVTINAAGARGDDSVTGSGSYGSATTPITVLIPYSGAAPTGTISVADTFGNALTIAASNCQASGGALVCSASLTTASEPVGANPATVAQAADANHSASTGAGVITISKAASSTADTATGAGTYGAATTAVTVSIPYPGPAAPTGAVSVTDSLGNTVSTPGSACSAASQTLTCVVSLPTMNEPIGSNPVTVTQAGDANYSGSTGAGAVTIAMSTVSPVGSTSAGVQNVTINQGTASTLLTATLSFAGATPPTGAVTFTVTGGSPVTASCTLGSTLEICTAMYPTGTLQTGTYTITAAEAADANYGAGSATATLTVASGSVSPILDNVSDVSNVLITAGTQTAALSASITFNGPVPTGGLTFNIPGGTPLAATCTGGSSPLTCTTAYPTASLAVGTYVITATEAADGTYPQGAATALLTVAPNAGTPISPILTTGSNVSSVLVPYGTPTATLTVNIQYNGPVPTGAVTFAVQDGSGNSAVAACVQGSSSPTSLTCTAPWATASLGIGSYLIEVNEAADANYPAGFAIGTLTVTQVSAASNDTVSGTGTYGAATTPITATIPYVGNTAPTGDVTVKDALGNTVTLPGSGCTASTGVLTCAGALPTANAPVGSDAATVSQAADSTYLVSTGSGTITISKAAATSSDTVTGTSTYGAPTTTVTVTIPYTGATPPTGAITVTDGQGNTVTVPASSCTAAGGVLTCTASLPTANVTVGPDLLTVTQAGDANYSGSTGSGAVTVSRAPATTTDTASGTSTYGAASTAVTITIPYAGAVPPTGAVSVTDAFGNTATIPGLSCTAAKGTLTCLADLSTANEPLGNNPVAVTQIGDANYAGSTGTGTVTIDKAVAGNDSASGTGTYGAATTPITVTIPYNGATAPNGTITVTDTHGNTVTVSSCAASSRSSIAGTLSCSANLPTATEPVGANAVTVSQIADASHSASTGTGTVTINKAPLTGADTATGTGTYGGATTQVSVSIPYAGTAAPTGVVTITDGQGNTIAVPASSCTAAAGVLTCTASLPTANVAVGPDALTITQAGDANYSGSTGTGSLTISKAAGGADAASGTGTYGAATTPISVTIPYTGSTAPTGAITVVDTHGNTVTASNCRAAGGVLTCSANLPTANEPVGANPVTVSQVADASHVASTGAGTVTINKAPLTSTDTVTGTGTYGGATTQVTVTIPYAGAAAPTGAVTLTDSLGNTITVPASSCTAAGGALTCTVSLPTANEPVGANQVTVTQAPDANYGGSTGSGSVTINKAGASTDTVSGTGTYGAATTPVSVTIPFVGTTAPSGAITVTDTHGNSVNVPPPSCSAAKAVLTCTANLPTANDPAGSNAVTVAQAADANSSGSTGTGTITLAKAAATSADTATGSGKFGVATTAVTVSIPYAGAAAPTGAITLTDTLGNTVTVAATNCAAASGVLTCTANLPTANEPVGSNSIMVAQAGDTNYSGSTGSGTVMIAKATPTLTAPTVSPMNSALGTSVTITQTVPSNETGTVTFMSGTTVLGTGTIVNGVATLTTTALPLGTDSITATANGDANYSAATSPAVTDTVGGNTVAVALSSSQSTTTIGTGVTFSAAVSATPSSTVAGTVTFYDGTTVLGTATVSNGVGTLGTSSLSVGNHTITASFTPAASSTLSTATSAAISQVVQPVAASIGLTSSQLLSIVQQSVTFSATVPATAAGVAPSGMVTFYDGTTVLGTVPLGSSGVALYTTSALSGGAHNITASYAGDANYAAVTSTPIAQKVGDFGVGNTTPTMSVDPGGATAFNIKIDPANGVAFSAPVVLTVTGLPSGATSAFSAGTVTPGTAGATSTMTVQSLAQKLTAMEHHQHVKNLEAAAAWACLFPLLGVGRIRRRLPKALLTLAVLVGSFGVIAPLTGCGGGYFGPAPASYTLTVTGTSGKLQRTTTVTLNIR